MRVPEQVMTVELLFLPADPAVPRFVLAEMTLNVVVSVDALLTLSDRHLRPSFPVQAVDPGVW